MEPINKFSRAASWLVSVLFAWSQPAFALGMGEPLQQSFLAEPLRLEVPVTLGELEAGELSVRVMPRLSAYDGSSSDFVIDVSDIKARVVQLGSEHAVVIESKRAVRQPVIEMSLELTGGGLKVLRDLTLLMEPRPSTTTQAVVNSAPTAVTNVKLPERQPTPPAPAVKNEPGLYGPVQAHETLKSVAARLPGVAREDRLRAAAALMLLNPEAVTQGDSTRLRTGTYLRIPSDGNIQNAPADLVRAISSESARQSSRKPAVVVAAKSTSTDVLLPRFRLRLDPQFSSFQRLQLVQTPSTPIPAAPAIASASMPDTADATDPASSVGVEDPAASAVLPPMTATAEQAPPVASRDDQTPASTPREFSLMTWVLLFMSVVLAVVLIRQMRQPVMAIHLPPPPKPNLQEAESSPMRRRLRDAIPPLKLVRSSDRSSPDYRREVQALMNRLNGLRSAFLGEDSELRKIMVIEAMIDEAKLAEASQAIAHLEALSASDQSRPA